jgi:hypothetical protein
VSGETGEVTSGWTTDTLKAHFDTLRATDQKNMEQRFTAAETSVNRALATADKANEKGDNAIEKRFEGVNEFRKTLSDQAATFMPRSEVETLVKAIDEKIDDLRGTRRTGFASVGAIVVGGVVVLGVLANIIILLVNHA